MLVPQASKRRRIGAILAIIVVLALALIAVAVAFMGSRHAFTRRDEGVPRAAGPDRRAGADPSIEIAFLIRRAS